MLAIFKRGLIEAPKELHVSSSSSNYGGISITDVNKPKQSEEILNDFLSSESDKSTSVSFGNAVLAYTPAKSFPQSQQRGFCGLDGVYCIFLGGLNNLSSLIKQYGLSKNASEAMFVIEAYRTLRDRGPYPADQVLKGLDGSFGFVVFDSQTGTVFAALGANEGVKLFWGIAADGSVVISDKLEVIKPSCAKSFAPFPSGCMFHSEQGLMSFEHPMNKMKAFPRIDSEGSVCGASFKVDVYSKVNSMPRVGSEANWCPRQLS